MLHSKQWHYSLHRDFQNCYSTRRSPTGFFKLQFQLQFYTCTLHYNPENSPSRIQFYIQKTKSSSSTTTTFQRAKRPSFQKRNSMHRRQGDLLEMHPCVLHDIPVTPVAPETFQTFQSFMTFQPLQAILQRSSISRESTPFQHSPIRMHILQFDWFPQKTPPSTSWAITDITNIHSSKKGRCWDIGQIDIFFRIELLPLSSLSSDNTNCKNDIPLFHQLFDELSVYRDYH